MTTHSASWSPGLLVWPVPGISATHVRAQVPENHQDARAALALALAVSRQHSLAVGRRRPRLCFCLHTCCSLLFVMMQHLTCCSGCRFRPWSLWCKMHVIQPHAAAPSRQLLQHLFGGLHRCCLWCACLDSQHWLMTGVCGSSLCVLASKSG